MATPYVFEDGSKLYGKKNNSYVETLFEEDTKQWVVTVGLVVESMEEDGTWDKRHARISSKHEDYIIARESATVNFAAFLEVIDFNLWNEKAKEYLVD